MCRWFVSALLLETIEHSNIKNLVFGIRRISVRIIWEHLVRCLQLDRKSASDKPRLVWVGDLIRWTSGSGRSRWDGWTRRWRCGIQHSDIDVDRGSGQPTSARSTRQLRSADSRYFGSTSGDSRRFSPIHRDGHDVIVSRH